MHSFKTYRVINEGLVRQWAQQLDLPIDVEESQEGEFGSNIKVLGGKRKKSRKAAARAADDPRIVEGVVDGMRGAGVLSGIRPETCKAYYNGEHTGWVVERDLLATPVTLPLGRSVSSPEPGIITVWVSDPLPLESVYSEFEFAGSFLFIVEELEGPAELKEGGGWFISGASALRAMLNHTAGLEAETARHDEMLVDPPYGHDSFGRDDPTDPIDKLKGIDGTVGRNRAVEAVYRIAYMTNEQAHTVGDEVVRVNDIVAYPLYIAETSLYNDVAGASNLPVRG